MNEIHTTKDHNYPKDPAEHLWGPWMQNTSPPKPTRVRSCQHPDCHAFEIADQPQG